MSREKQTNASETAHILRSRKKRAQNIHTVCNKKRAITPYKYGNKVIRNGYTAEGTREMERYIAACIACMTSESSLLTKCQHGRTECDDLSAYRAWSGMDSSCNAAQLSGNGVNLSQDDSVR